MAKIDKTEVYTAEQGRALLATGIDAKVKLPVKKSEKQKQLEAYLQQHRIKALEKALQTQVVAEEEFHPDRKWRFDFYLPAYKIALEVEGGVWTQGRHTRGKGYLGDMEKYNTAAAMGFTVLRFTPEQLLQAKAIQTIRQAILTYQELTHEKEN